MSGDQFLALRLSNDHVAPNTLVSLDPGTGKETPYFYFDVPIEADTLTTPDVNDVVVQNGRIFFGARAAIGPGADGNKWVYLVLGIGSVAEKP
ncbi:hypothetical protein AB0E81_29770 [Streptomyces sp. NPDC033538]|uniref:hypothetical protein n=1 Tax=Streptomyces sp. NPDC033538 TaxID=3155367 RepID=UPI0033E063B3